MRRVIRFLAALVSVGLLGALGTGGGFIRGSQVADAQTVSRPNFVFVMTDDLDERSMQDLPGIRDIMATNGTTFNNAYVTYSLCAPSRATNLRGQYPHNHEIIGNGLPEGGEEKFRKLGLDRSTVATWLNDAGYRTSYIGVYMTNYLFKDGLYIPPGWDEWFVLREGYYNLDDPTQAVVNDNGHKTTLGDHSSDVFADKASDFIRTSSANPAPFFVMVGARAPHGPPDVAARYQDRFADTPLPMPLNFDEADTSDKPQWVQSLPRLTGARVSTMQDTYRQRLRSMLSVEDLLKQILATLQETGELDNTYIFFTSDNGYHIGNHRLDMGKKTPYEEDVGVPLMVRGPGVPAGAVRKQLVLNNDFAPTIAQLADASIPAFVDGSSFAPLLNASPPSSWRTAFLEEAWLEGGTTVTTPTHKSVYTQNHMFVEYDTGEYELYDLVLDPYQLESKPRAGNEQLYSTLQTRLNALRACSRGSCRSAELGTTTPTDTTSPRVTSTSPKHTATGVARSANLSATFSEKMDPSTLTNSTFKLFKVNADGSTTQVTNVAVTPRTDGLEATLDPFGGSASLLSRNATYKGVITTGAKDAAGNLLDQQPTTTGLQQKTWSFTTSP